MGNLPWVALIQTLIAIAAAPLLLGWVDQCRAWCALTGNDVVIAPDWLGNGFLRDAVADYPGDFSKLNEHQRRHIAGVKL